MPSRKIFRNERANDVLKFNDKIIQPNMMAMLMEIIEWVDISTMIDYESLFD